MLSPLSNWLQTGSSFRSSDSDAEVDPVRERSGVGGGGVSTTSESVTGGEGLLFRLDAGVMARVELALGENGAVLDGRLLVSIMKQNEKI